MINGILFNQPVGSKPTKDISSLMVSMVDVHQIRLVVSLLDIAFMCMTGGSQLDFLDLKDRKFLNDSLIKRYGDLNSTKMWEDLADILKQLNDNYLFGFVEKDASTITYHNFIHGVLAIMFFNECPNIYTEQEQDRFFSVNNISTICMNDIVENFYDQDDNLIEDQFKTYMKTAINLLYDSSKLKLV